MSLKFQGFTSTQVVSEVLLWSAKGGSSLNKTASPPICMSFEQEQSHRWNGPWPVHGKFFSHVEEIINARTGFSSS